ncbi:unnamed protein product, partial [Urochloa humidicola]
TPPQLQTLGHSAAPTPLSLGSLLLPAAAALARPRRCLPQLLALPPASPAATVPCSTWPAVASARWLPLSPPSISPPGRPLLSLSPPHRRSCSCSPPPPPLLAVASLGPRRGVTQRGRPRHTVEAAVAPRGLAQSTAARGGARPGCPDPSTTSSSATGDERRHLTWLLDPSVRQHRAPPLPHHRQELQMNPCRLLAEDWKENWTPTTSDPSTKSGIGTRTTQASHSLSNVNFYRLMTVVCRRGTRCFHISIFFFICELQLGS